MKASDKEWAVAFNVEKTYGGDVDFENTEYEIGTPEKFFRDAGFMANVKRAADELVEVDYVDRRHLDIVDAEQLAEFFEEAYDAEAYLTGAIDAMPIEAYENVLAEIGMDTVPAGTESERSTIQTTLLPASDARRISMEKLELFLNSYGLIEQAKESIEYAARQGYQRAEVRCTVGQEERFARYLELKGYTVVSVYVDADRRWEFEHPNDPEPVAIVVTWSPKGQKSWDTSKPSNY